MEIWPHLRNGATKIARPDIVRPSYFVGTDIARMDNVAPARKGGNREAHFIVRVFYCSVQVFYDVSDNVK